MSAIRSLKSATAAFRTVSLQNSSRFVVKRVAVPAFSRIQSTSLARNFHVSAFARGQGETDLELSSKLKEEIKYEKEAAAEAGPIPEFIEDFKKSGVWQIEEAVGNDEVAFTRKFGNETIRVLFSIADIENTEDVEFDDEGNQVEAEEEPVSPVRCAVTITKPNTGALSIDCVAQNGTFQIDNISYYADGKLATELSAEADWKRRGLYVGPQFDHLDVGVQESFDKYLEERGVGANLALFIPDYAQYKEQQEYTKWLEQVNAFIAV